MESLWDHVTQWSLLVQAQLSPVSRTQPVMSCVGVEKAYLEICVTSMDAVTAIQLTVLQRTVIIFIHLR